jgi:hypothetical protein
VICPRARWSRPRRIGQLAAQFNEWSTAARPSPSWPPSGTLRRFTPAHQCTPLTALSFRVDARAANDPLACDELLAETDAVDHPNGSRKTC